MLKRIDRRSELWKVRSVLLREMSQYRDLDLANIRNVSRNFSLCSLPPKFSSNEPKKK
jgi:hypothetical protein